MPPRKTKPSNRMYRKAKKAVANRKKIRAKKNLDTFFLKARVLGVCAPSQGVTVANYFSSFWQLLDPISAVGVTQNAEFNLYKNLYDKVRVNSITVKFTAKANVNTAFDNQDDALKINNGDGKIHTVVLRDNDGYATNISRLSRMPSYRGVSVLKNWMRKYTITYPPNVWLDCQNIYSDETLLERLGCYGGIGAYGENFMEDVSEVLNEPIGSVEITYNCVFQGKVLTSLTFNEGSVTVSSLPTIVYAPTPLKNIQGTIADTVIDLSGDEVPTYDTAQP